jgi:hypothetical protein
MWRIACNLSLSQANRTCDQSCKSFLTISFTGRRKRGYGRKEKAKERKEKKISLQWCVGAQAFFFRTKMHLIKYFIKVTREVPPLVTRRVVPLKSHRGDLDEKCQKEFNDNLDISFAIPIRFYPLNFMSSKSRILFNYLSVSLTFRDRNEWENSDSIQLILRSKILSSSSAKCISFSQRIESFMFADIDMEKGSSAI